MTTVEICTEGVHGAAAAQAGGADRIELCAALSEGGLTPTPATLRHALRTAPKLAVTVLVRVRGGDFVHDEDEIAVMADDIRDLRAAAATVRGEASSTVGFTLGTLHTDGTIDTAALARLLAACGPAPVTFHKAFDAVPDPAAALEQLIDAGVSRVLTAGGRGPATEHLELLTALVGHSAGRIQVLVGGGVRANNVARVVAATGAGAVHLRADRSLPPRGAAYGPDPVAPRAVTSATAVAEVVAAVRAGAAA